MLKTNGNAAKHQRYEPHIDWRPYVFLFIASLFLFGFRCFVLSADILTADGMKILTAVGALFLIVGILDTLVEARMDLPFFYGKNQGGGSNANSYFVCAVGIACLADSILRYFIYMAATTAVIAAERYGVEELRCRKKEKYIGMTGIAESDIDYKGIGNFGGQLLKIRVTDKAIEKGMPICITDVDGFHLIVRSRYEAEQEEKPNKKWAV